MAICPLSGILSGRVTIDPERKARLLAEALNPSPEAAPDPMVEGGIPVATSKEFDRVWANLTQQFPDFLGGGL